ncbi:MAG: putative bifunctional diguanylate cyclase/phosphodiesterase [Spirochaetaceae bacterium]
MENIENLSREELEILAKFPEENPNPVMRIEPSGRILYANKHAQELLEENGISYTRSLPPKLMEKLLHSFPSGTTEEVALGDNYYRVLCSRASHTESVFLFWQEITLQKRYEELLNLSNSVIENTIEGIFVTSSDGIIERVNPAFTQITGFEPSEALGETPRILKSDHQNKDFYRRMWEDIAEKGFWNGEIWNRRKDGKVIPLWLSIAAIYDTPREKEKFVAVFHDISQIKHTEEKLKKQTYYDPLTGLPNRQLFYDRLNKAIASAKRNESKIAVLLMDVDYFKKINDSLGHYIGDEYLKVLGKRLQEGTREEDTLARLGGDEFALLNVNIRSQNEVIDIIGRVRSALVKPISIENHEIVPGASIGVTYYPDDGTDADTLLKNADLAMYKTKENERGSYSLFNPLLHEQAQRRIELETNMNRALASDEFKVYYQPKIDIAAMKPHGFEALVRWHCGDTVVSPADFIPVAEETGLIFPLGRRILHKACSDLTILNQKHFGTFSNSLHMAVNLSAKQFQDAGLVNQLKSILEETGAHPSLISVEITENIAISDLKSALHMMQEITGTGVHISIDDFGTGYSSLAYIRRFTAQEVKIDKSFIDDITEDGGDKAIVQAVITMAHNIGMRVVAEGVETQEQLNLLGSMGCDLVQGYFFSKPLPLEELIVYLEGWDY